MPKEFPLGYPTWVDKFYFNDILRKDYSQFKVVVFNVGPVTAKGENYASSMFRVKMTVESPSGLVERKFIVKSPLATFGEMDPALKAAFNVFPKEIQMYMEVLPKFQALYKKVGEEVTFGPTCFVGTSDPNDLIIMDDLGMKGFRSADRVAGLDADHVRLTISKLAQMHAASAVYIDQGNAFDAKFNSGIYSEAMRAMMETMMAQSMDIQLEVMSKWKCVDILKKYDGKWNGAMVDKLYTVIKRDEKRFNVLCHGDLWCNNVMFRYNEDTGKVEECLLVDFQMSYYNTPMLDLQYFIYSSTQHEIKMNKVDHIIQFYHQQLVANLKKLGYTKKPPTLLDLQKDFLEVGIFGLMTSFGTFNIAVAPSADDMDMESFMKDDAAGKDFKRRLYTNPVYVNAMEDLIPYFDRKGILDF